MIISKNSYSVTVAGDYAYVGTQYKGLSIIDISDL
ncbi:hypothetical protein KA005_69500, partial [bacterium]|nr:hypothetical protein [bacterium]